MSKIDTQAFNRARNTAINAITAKSAGKFVNLADLAAIYGTTRGAAIKEERKAAAIAEAAKAEAIKQQEIDKAWAMAYAGA